VLLAGEIRVGDGEGEALLLLLLLLALLLLLVPLLLLLHRHIRPPKRDLASGQRHPQQKKKVYYRGKICLGEQQVGSRVKTPPLIYRSISNSAFISINRIT
jgi:hypothetical protein